MHYEERKPAPALKEWVRCYWFLHGAEAEHPFETVLPDGSMEAIFQFADPFVQREGSSIALQSGAILSGEIRRPTVIAPTGRVQLAAIRFRPGRAYRFFRTPMSAIAGSTLPLPDVWDQAWSLHDELAAEPSPARCSAIFDRFLLATARDADAQYDAIAAAISRAKGAVSISKLANGAGLSPRLLQRRFRERAGLGPKSLARVLRFQNAVSAMTTATGERIRHMLVEGYYDQSHFINDFREFSGLSPRAWLATQHRLTDLFTS